jgi:hypothetical protein
MLADTEAAVYAKNVNGVLLQFLEDRKRNRPLQLIAEACCSATVFATFEKGMIKTDADS